MIAMPNMDKPKRCVDCVCNNDDYMCNATHMEIDWQSQQVNEDCPLIEIVRCKDCKYAKYRIEGTEYDKCMITQLFVNKSDFCSYGERRSNE